MRDYGAGGGANQVRATQKWGWTLFRLGRVCFTNYHFYSTNPVNNLIIVNKGWGVERKRALDMSDFLLQSSVVNTPSLTSLVCLYLIKYINYDKIYSRKYLYFCVAYPWLEA